MTDFTLPSEFRIHFVQKLCDAPSTQPSVLNLFTRFLPAGSPRPTSGHVPYGPGFLGRADLGVEI